MGSWIYTRVMKLRLLILLLGIGLLSLFIIVHAYIIDIEYQSCDMIEVNDQFKQIVKELDTDTIERIEEKYNCNIILREDTDYQQKLYKAIRKGNVILDYIKGEILIGKVIFPSNSDSFIRIKRSLIIGLWSVYIGTVIILIIVLWFIHIRVLRPFQRLKRFADQISVGNLDIPLLMDKDNYFGAFTESFDMMREELKKARVGEYEANISKKELVAGLSHDIKTPVATITALCEILEIKLKEEDALTKVRTIGQKADMIDKLISNMFHATLEELEALKIEPKEELSTILTPMFDELNHYGKLYIKNHLPECLIYCDKLRLNQVIDNIINNSYKYANTKIEVTYLEAKEVVLIEIRDFGVGISEENLPLIFEKFYRGDNASAYSGAGLGLYLARQFMEGMKGSIECFVDHGFIAVLTIKKV